jgi:hypothetical protein
LSSGIKSPEVPAAFSSKSRSSGPIEAEKTIDPDDSSDDYQRMDDQYEEF